MPWDALSERGGADPPIPWPEERPVSSEKLPAACGKRLTWGGQKLDPFDRGMLPRNAKMSGRKVGFAGDPVRRGTPKSG